MAGINGWPVQIETPSVPIATPEDGLEITKRQAPRRRGRPPKGAEAKRASFNTRLRQGLKEQLEIVARAAGRSLSEEIEHRLEQSFRGDRVEKELADLRAIIDRIDRRHRHLD